MPQILRVKMNWSGFQGGPGLSVFHFQTNLAEGGAFDEASSAASQIKTFAGAIQNLLPSTGKLQVDSTVEEINEHNGALIGWYTVPPHTPTSSSAASGQQWAGAAGAVINWRTAGVRNRRRINGRTFLVPLVGVFDTDGTINSMSMTTLQNAANALVTHATSPDMGVWSRPTPILDSEGKRTGEYNSDGVWHPAVAARVLDKSAVLRSRRD